MLRQSAQMISEAASAIVGFGVLVTDADGIIIGCDDVSRVGSLHAPSLSVYRERKPVVTSELDAEGEKFLPGFTLPIYLYDEIVGTISLAGRPEEVEKYGLLVQKQAEIMLRERAYLESGMHKTRASRDLVKNLAAYRRGVTSVDFSTILIQARELGWKIERCRAAVSVEMREWGGKADDAFRLMEEGLRRAFSCPDNFICTHGNYSVTLFFAPVLPKDTDECVTRGVRSALCEFASLMRGRGITVKAAVGLPAHKPEDIPASLRAARAILDIPCESGEDSVILAADHTAEMLLELLPGAEAEEYSARVLKGLPAKKDYQELRRTFTEWCKSPFDASAVAGRLSLHRNTLQYRLRKLRGITGKDTRRFKDAFELWAAFAVRESLAKKKNQ